MNFNKKAVLGEFITTFIATVLIILILLIFIFSSGTIKTISSVSSTSSSASSVGEIIDQTRPIFMDMNYKAGLLKPKELLKFLYAEKDANGNKLNTFIQAKNSAKIVLSGGAG